MTSINVNKLILQKLKDVSSSGQLDAEDADQRENLHRLFIYPAMMVPATQSAIIKVLAEFLPSDTYAMDPFMGSGTSLLSCMEFGFHAYGQDINPFAVLLSKAKTSQFEIIELESAYNRIEGRIRKDEDERIDINFRGIDKWFTKKAQISFSKIRRAIQEEYDFKIRSFFWVLMSEAVRVGSNDRTTTFKLHKRSDEELQRRNVNVIKEFFQIAKRGIEDYAIFCEKLQAEHNQYDMSFRGDITVKWGNTQKRIETEEKFGLLVSSPPYGDNQTTVTYGQTSYLPLQWIDTNDIECPYNYLRTTQEIDRQSLGGHLSKKIVKEELDAICKKSPRFKSFYELIPDSEKGAYNKTIAFISDFAESLSHIVEKMNTTAYYIWTIGNRFVGGREIPNTDILEDLMALYNIPLFFRAERQILNKKQANKNNFSRTMEKETIMIFHKEEC